jgi:hypothetical protein
MLGKPLLVLRWETGSTWRTVATKFPKNKAIYEQTRYLLPWYAVLKATENKDKPLSSLGMKSTTGKGERPHYNQEPSLVAKFLLPKNVQELREE